MTDSVLIVGGGIAGLTAAQRVTDAGAHAIVVERRAIVGGKLAAPMTESLAIGNRAEGESIPLFDALSENENIEIITNATLESIDGRAGNFTVSIRERARFVTDACTRCKLCHGVCPVVLPNEFDAGLTFRKAIYTPMLKTLPEAWAIDIENCLNTPPNYLPCNRCIEVCEDNAIHFDQALETFHDRHVGAVILAPGMEIGTGEGFEELGYGAHPDIVTSAELQRLLESPGPTGGYASKPSDEEYPERVLLVLDDPSPFALYIVASQAQQLIDQDIEHVTVLVLSPPTSAEAAQQLTEKTGIEVHWGAAFNVDPKSDDGIAASFEDFTEKKYVKKNFDMIVLCVDVEPPTGLDVLASTTGIAVGKDGYFEVSGANGQSVETSHTGIYVAGCGSGPKNISASISGAKAATDAALAQLNPILLDSESDTASQQSATPPEEDMRAQIEKLLHALINQPSS
jgi:heterodisulfide reductase subunit A